MAKSKSIVLDAPVQFGGVAIGDSTARLGVRFARDVLNLEAADELLCNHRLTGAAILGRNGDAPGQKALIDDAGHRVDGTFDVKGFRCTMDTIATGLTFSLADIDVAELAKLSKGEGRLLIEAVGEIPEEVRDKKPSNEGAVKADGPWRKVPLDDLFHPGQSIRKALAEAGIDTMGQLADWSSKGNNLTDIKGIGVEKATAIEDAMERFWKANPDARDEQ